MVDDSNQYRYELDTYFAWSRKGPMLENYESRFQREPLNSPEMHSSKDASKAAIHSLAYDVVLGATPSGALVVTREAEVNPPRA